MLRALLFEPWAVFGRRGEDLNGGRGAAPCFGLAVCLTGVVGAALWFLSRQMTGTVTVDDPDRPADTLCDRTVPMEVTPSGCDEPAEIDRQMGSLFWEASSDVVPLLFVGLLLVLGLLAVVLYAGARVTGGTGGFGPTLEETPGDSSRRS